MNDDKEIEWPSIYDDFYYNYNILEKLLDLSKVMEFFNNKGIDFEKNISGYLYFIELIAIQIMYRLELLLGNEELEEFVRWGRKDISDKQIKKLSSSNVFLGHIYKINTLRRKLSKIRFNHKQKTDDILQVKDINLDIKLSVSELNKLFIKSYKIVRIKNRKSIEKLSILYWINDFNFIDWYFDTNSSIFNDIPSPISLPKWPGHPFFYLMPKQTKENYSLQNPRIKKNNQEYFNGFKTCLLFLYLNAFKEKAGYFEIRFKQVSDWAQLDNLAQEIYETFITGKLKKKAIFSINEPSSKSDKPLLSRIIHVNKKEQFDTIFRGRDIKVIDKSFTYDDYAQDWFLHILFGSLSRKDFFNFHHSKEKPEIIEFQQLCGIFTEYSYAFYFPKYGAFSNSSHWIIFDELDSEAQFDHRLYFKKELENILKEMGTQINFKSIIVEGNILKRYMQEKDKRLKKDKSIGGKLSHSKGIISEFLSYLYVNKRYGAKLIDIEREIDVTDIDVLAETKDSLILIQAKQHLPFDKNILIHDVVNHFSKVEKKLESEHVKKIFFVMHTPNLSNLPNSESIVILNEKRQRKSEKSKSRNQPKNDSLKQLIDTSIVQIDENVIKRKCEEIRKFLRERDIELVFFEDLKSLLSNNADLIKKLDEIYEINKKSNIFNEV